MGLLKGMAIAACMGVVAVVGIFIAVAWHSRKAERAQRPEAGRKRAKR